MISTFPNGARLGGVQTSPSDVSSRHEHHLGTAAGLHGAVLAWLETVNDADLHLSAVTIEIQAGIERARENDSSKAEALERWLDQVHGYLYGPAPGR